MMGERMDKVARGIKSFVENPVTNLVKGVVLLGIGLSEASHTIRDDLTSGHVRIGHGLIIIGLFSVLEALPNVIGTLEAGLRYHEFREKKRRARDGEDGP